MPQNNQTAIAEPQIRSATFERSAINEDARTVELAFSSETPVQRWYGVEILDHAPSSVRLERLSDGAPLLAEHNTDQQIGVVESVTLSSDAGRAKVRFSRSDEAQTYFQDVIDGIRRHVSIRYRVHERRLESEKDGEETFRVTDWEPLEVSIVSVPADHTVGVGRSAETSKQPNPTQQTNGNQTMPGQKTTDAVATESQAATSTPRDASTDTQQRVNVEQVTNDTRTAELTRIRELRAAGAHYQRYGGDDLASRGIEEGWDMARFNQEMLGNLPTADSASTGNSTAASELGMSQRDLSQYSLLRAIDASVNNDWSRAGFELECSTAIADELGREARGFFVPMEIQSRTLTTDSASSIVATDHLAGGFIDILRANSVVMGLGATTLDGLQGIVSIPRQDGAASFYWLNEDEDVPDSEMALGSVQLSPKTVAGSVPMSRRLLKQSSPSIESLIQSDLIKGAALAIDLAALEGAGGNQPTGVIGTTGISTTAIAAPGQPTFAESVSFETKINTDNALAGSLAYVTTPSVVGALKTTPRDSGSGVMLADGDRLNGYRLASSSQIQADTIVFGNWADVMIGMWGILDIMPDKAAKAASGGLVLRVFQDVDIAVRHPQSFCVSS